MTRAVIVKNSAYPECTSLCAWPDSAQYLPN